LPGIGTACLFLHSPNGCVTTRPIAMAGASERLHFFT
jgi:hypothetical protein